MRPQFARTTLVILSAFHLVNSANCATVYDTSGSWNGSSVAVPFRLDGSATFGQTITAPLQDSVLTNFSVWVYDYYSTASSTPLTFGAYVAAWDGSKIVGPILYSSGLRSAATGAPMGFTKHSFNTGGIEMDPGGSYAIFISLSDFSPLGVNGSGGVGTPFGVDAYSGGMMVNSANGTNFTALSTNAWYSNPGADFAFQASFIAKPSAPPLARGYHTAVWTGTKMLVWGGNNSSTGFLNDGGIFDPSANTWATIPTNSAPSRRFAHTAVWTGSDMLVWGGTTNGSPLSYFNSGGRFNLQSNAWTATTTTGAPTGRYSHTAVWTGDLMLIWGGLTSSGYSSSGAAYLPPSDSWLPLSTASGFPRAFHTAVWSGASMVSWGGYYSGGWLRYGVQYYPSNNSWGNFSTTITTPSARQDHTAIWTGTEMIVWGGRGSGGRLGDGGRYNPFSDTWSSMAGVAAPSARSGHTAVWTGTEMIIWGGRGDASGSYVHTGGRYNPTSNIWTATSTDGAPSPRSIHTAVWTGSEMLVWGGFSTDTGYVNDGGRYDPATDTWKPFPISIPPPLSIRVESNATVQVSWPASAVGFQLQKSTNLTAPNWTAVTQTPNNNGTNKTILEGLSSGSTFYRLQ
jgi:N-acetylneuraminic acid mutarotase